MTFLSLTAQEVQQYLIQDFRHRFWFDYGLYFDELVELTERPEDEVDAAIRELKARDLVVGTKGLINLKEPDQYL